MLFLVCAVIFTSIFFPFITTVAVAAIFASVLNPSIKKIQLVRIFGFSIKSRKKCAALLLLFLICLFIIPFLMMTVKMYAHFAEFSQHGNAKEEFVHKLSQYIMKSEEEITHFISRFGLRRRVNVDDVSGELAQKAANIIFDRAAYVIRQLPSFLTATLIFLIALFYLLAESHKIKTFFQRLGLFSFREISIVTESLRTSSYSAVISSLLAGIVHGLVLAIGAQALGVGDFSFVFMLTFFLSFIPVIGAAVMALGLCIVPLVEQNYTAAMVLLVVALFASALDSLVRPYLLVYGKNAIHPFVALLSVLGGIYVLGISGLFIGPVLVQVTIESLPKLVRLAPNPRVN